MFTTRLSLDVNRGSLPRVAEIPLPQVRHRGSGLVRNVVHPGRKTATRTSQINHTVKPGEGATRCASRSRCNSDNKKYSVVVVDWPEIWYNISRETAARAY